jgi:chromosome segregation ATPase
MNMINDGGPERIWIESDGGCPYFYPEEELSDVAPPITEYVRADKLEELAAEIEALRAEVAEWKRVAAAQAELHDKAEARAERLAEALRELEEREQRDEALLRQALEALELRCGTHADERKELIPALRERLGEGAEP